MTFASSCYRWIVPINLKPADPMDKAELPFLSATELASLIKSKEVSPVEATEAYLERIPQLDPKLNSYITVTADRAMADARRAEQEIASGKYRGPRRPVPATMRCESRA